MTDVLALDGEGKLVQGEHRYLLLCASDGDRLESQEEALSTDAILQFLLGKAKPGRRMVMFGMSYDVTHWLKDLSDLQLFYLYRVGKCFYRCRGETVMIEYIPRKYLRLSTKKKHCLISDVFGFFQCSFVEALKIWGVGSEGVWNEIQEMKELRGVFSELPWDSIRRYCLWETRLLVQLVERFEAAIERIGLHLRSWHGSACLARALLRLEEMQDIVQEVQEPVEGLFKAGYYGGRIELYGVGLIDGPVWSYDIRSAYPASLAALPRFRQPFQHCSTFREDGYGIWRCTWDIPYPCPTGPFPYRRRGLIYYPLRGEGWYWTPEVKVALQQFSGIRVEEGWWHPDEGERPFAWIEDWYRLRRTLPEADRVIKCGLNSLYGVLAQTQGEYTPWQSFCYAGLITSLTRARLLLALSRAWWRVQERDLWSLDISGPFLSVMTDSLLAREPIDLPLGDQLGMFSVKEFSPGLLLMQPGVIFHPDYHAYRTRGFHPRATVQGKPITYDLVRGIWERDGLTGVLKVEDYQFQGLGISLVGRKVDRKRYGQWLLVEKQIKFSPLPRKWPASFSRQSYYWLVTHGGFGGVSEPYRKKAHVRRIVEEIEQYPL